MDTTHIDMINQDMSPDSFKIPDIPKADYGKRPGMDIFFYGLTPEYGNFTQHPNTRPEYLFEDVYANGIIAKVVTNMLGPRPQLRWINGNLVSLLVRAANHRNLVARLLRKPMRISTSMITLTFASHLQSTFISSMSDPTTAAPNGGWELTALA